GTVGGGAKAQIGVRHAPRAFKDVERRSLVPLDRAVAGLVAAERARPHRRLEVPSGLGAGARDLAHDGRDRPGDVQPGALRVRAGAPAAAAEAGRARELALERLDLVAVRVRV